MAFRKNTRDNSEEDEPFGFGFLFDDFDARFQRMQRYMDRVFEKVQRGELPAPEEGGPLVYGWSFRWDGGQPRFEEFGNVKGLFSAQPEHSRIRLPSRLGLAAPGRPGLEPGSREPLTDVIESEKTLNVTAEMPGIERSDIDLETAEDTLTIKVDRKDRKYHKPKGKKVKVN